MKNKTWYAKKSGGFDFHGQGLVISEATGENIAVVYNGARDMELLAAAPDMAEALELCRALIEAAAPVLDKAVVKDALNTARAALSKAGR